MEKTWDFNLMLDEKKRDLTCCFDLIDQAERVGRCHYVCKNCKKDVSLLWFFYQQAISVDNKQIDDKAII